MDETFLNYYSEELSHVREVLAEFGRQHRKIAGRLALDGIESGIECPDPYVERLVEGFAYMAARVRLKVDAEFPEFIQHLLDVVYPDVLSPIPSMGVVQFIPDLTKGELNGGVTISRQERLDSQLGKDEQTPCEYRTAHDVTLWPLTMEQVRYLPDAAAVEAMGVERRDGVEAGLLLQLAVPIGLSFRELPLDRLALYVSGDDAVAMSLYEQLAANSCGVVVRPRALSASRRVPALVQAGVRMLGFADEEALLPTDNRVFRGYRLLKEYFALRQRYTMVELHGLQPAIAGCAERQLDIVVLLNRRVASLVGAITTERLRLFCTPVINLFEKICDRIPVSPRQREYHVVPDRTRQQDFEVYLVKSVRGYAAGNRLLTEFRPFYTSDEVVDRAGGSAYYAVRRRQSLASEHEDTKGWRSKDYHGTEVFVSLVDPTARPFPEALRQLQVETLCTNRDLPLHVPVGRLNTDLSLLRSGVHLSSIRFVAGPTEPRQPPGDPELAWKLISLLSLNHLPLVGRDTGGPIRRLLSIFAQMCDPKLLGQANGVSVTAEPAIGRLSASEEFLLGRGLSLSLTLDESAFEGSGGFLLGAVLAEFFSRYVSINSFAKTVIRTRQREVAEWPARTGYVQLI